MVKKYWRQKQAHKSLEDGQAAGLKKFGIGKILVKNVWTQNTCIPDQRRWQCDSPTYRQTYR